MQPVSLCYLVWHEQLVLPTLDRCAFWRLLDWVTWSQWECKGCHTSEVISMSLRPHMLVPRQVGSPGSHSCMQPPHESTENRHRQSITLQSPNKMRVHNPFYLCTHPPLSSLPLAPMLTYTYLILPPTRDHCPAHRYSVIPSTPMHQPWGSCDLHVSLFKFTPDQRSLYLGDSPHLIPMPQKWREVKGHWKWTLKGCHSKCVAAITAALSCRAFWDPGHKLILRHL